MNHNDATDKDLAASEQLLHKQLDEARQAATVGAMRAARPFLRPSQGRISNSRIPPMPIHTIPPPVDSDDDATIVYDRASNPKVSLGRLSTPSVPSVKAVAFPAPNFTAPRKPQPFSTIPAMPAAMKAAADASQGITPIQPVLPPTSRRELVVMPKPNESVPPVSFPHPHPSQFPSYPPVMQTGARGSMLAVVMTMAFALASMTVIAVAVFKPALLERSKVAVASAMKPKSSAPKVPQVTAAPPPPVTIAVPPILIDAEPDVVIGDTQSYAIFPQSAKGHRIFIDGRAIGDGDVPALVDCGRHKVQMGSSGKERTVDLPCGGGLRLSE